jgi:NAD(P)-dependent dehydrogenase (short-subunit alcohol dehydrogenase family)
MGPQKRSDEVPETILITGAGSGFGEGAALGLAAAGHRVIATTENWSQATALRHRCEELGLKTLEVHRLNLLDPYDVDRAAALDFDILVCNAGIGEGGAISEIPVELLRRNFETNVFAPLELVQKVLKRWVAQKKKGKVVFTSSVVGLASFPPIAPYATTKHAIEAIAEAMRAEMQPFGIQVQTINPGPYFTGFNETMVEAAFRWMDDDVNFIKGDRLKAIADGLLGVPEGRLDPKGMVERMVEIIPARTGQFRNVFPTDWEQRMRDHQRDMWKQSI